MIYLIQLLHKTRDLKNNVSVIILIMCAAFGSARFVHTLFNDAEEFSLFCQSLMPLSPGSDLQGNCE
jgi:hypothetical protein